MTDALNVPLIITISSTLVGTAAGAVGGYFFAKHKLTKDFEDELQKEIASVRKTFREHQDEKLILSGDEDGISLVAQPIVVVTEEERYCTSYTRSLFYGAHCNLYERSRKTACTVADYSRRKHYHGAGRK